jgi:hypothetical protein
VLDLKAESLKGSKAQKQNKRKRVASNDVLTT